MNEFQYRMPPKNRRLPKKNDHGKQIKFVVAPRNGSELIDAL